MCPAKEATTKGEQPRYRCRGRANMENYKVMRWLDQERERQGISLHGVARKMGPGYRNASRIGEYFRQQIVAGPDVLQRLAKAVNVSPIDALWNARHYGAVFNYLDKLYRLGWAWAHHDRVAMDQRMGADFMLHYADKPFPEGGDLREPPPHLAHRYHLATLYNNDESTHDIVALPKPMACAILLGISLFPRRGDTTCPETRDFFYDLSLIAEGMISQAEIARIPQQNVAPMQRPLKEAQDVLKYRFYGVERFAIAGEYVHKWCNFVCQTYTNYARLALYCEEGVLNVTDGNNDLRQYLHTTQPSADELRIGPAQK